jgi:predicted secreted Zn-dependent protease
MVEGISKRGPIMTEPGEMYLGAINIESGRFAYASDPTVCAVFTNANRWVHVSWDSKELEEFNGDVEAAARYIAETYNMG